MLKKDDKDLVFGETEEIKLKPILEKYFGLSLETTSQTDNFDYIDTESRVKIELKSRRNTKEKYPTTLLTSHKFNKGLELEEEGWKIIYVFNFTDKLSYWLSEDKEIKIKTAGRRDRGRPEYRNHLHIPINELVDIIF